MATKMSLKAKILLGVTVVAAVGAVVILTVILITGGRDTPNGGESSHGVSSTAPNDTSEPTDSTIPGNTSTSGNNGGNSEVGDAGMDSIDLPGEIAKLPAKSSLQDIFNCLSGYWITTGDPFVGFTFENDGSPVFNYGLKESGFWTGGKVIGSEGTGKYTFNLTIKIAAVPANEMNDAQPERTEKIYIDISGFYQTPNVLKVKIANLSDGGWISYKFGAGLFEDAYN